MRALAEVNIVAGETGAAGLAGVIELLAGSDAAGHRKALGINDTTRVLAFITEGATDPHAYAKVIADRP
jgi:diaminopropionate ammonia-lyase